jgi:hypothetical protein
MLNAEETAGALVAGRSISLEGKSYDDVAELAARAKEIGAEFFVGGDTSGDSGEEEFMVMGVVGVRIAVADVDGAPVEITRAAIDAGLERAGALNYDGFEELGELGTYLLCWGPLPAAGLCAGVRKEAKEEDGYYGKPDDVQYKYFGMQDMSQHPGSEGVDGVRVGRSVEFADVRRIDLSPAVLAAAFAEVPLLSNPSLFLTARYD